MRIFSLLLLTLVCTCASAQSVERDTSVKEVVSIDRADELRMIGRGENATTGR